MSLKDEIIRLIFFLVILIVTTSILTTLRVKDSYFQSADSGLKNADMVEDTNRKSILISIYNDFISLFTLDFGSTITGEKVNSHLLQRIEPTFSLALFSIFFGSMTGIFIFLYSIYLDNIYNNLFFIFLSKLILSTPVFLFGILFFIIFFMELGLLPPGGYERGNILFLILPGTTLGMRTFARLFLYGNEIGYIELNSPFFKILKARGFSDQIIIFKYLLIKVAPLLIVLIILDLSSLLSGAMVVEEIFFFPGIGKSTFTAIKNMDANLLKALLIYSGIIFYILNRFARNLQSILTNTKEL